MKRKLFTLFFVYLSCIIYAQEYPLDRSSDLEKQTIDITNIQNLDINGLHVKKVEYKGLDCIEAFLDDPSLRERFIEIPDVKFKDGIIELELTGEPGKYANELSKGFVGLVFHIQNDSTYEGFYLRPVNSVDKNQLQRNHSVQYISHPRYTWQLLRQENPGQYETYADSEPGEWTKLKLVVEGSEAYLYVNDASKPSMIVTDLKLGDNVAGSVGLWVGSATIAHFRNLQISQ